MKTEAAVRAAREALAPKVAGILLEHEIERAAELIVEIEELKAERNAIILGHNYMTPDVFFVSDYRGDSLGLAQEAARTQADVIVFDGVHFMAETAKILNPSKTVLLPDLGAGCSLAESITAEDVRALRAAHPDAACVCYINTTAAVKAECDACCTSANAVAVVEAMESDEVIMIPDAYLTANTQQLTTKKLIPWETGRCMVHEVFSAELVEAQRRTHPGLYVMAHPECPPEVIQAADYTGSTSQMIQRAGEVDAEKIFMVTECSMSDNVRSEHPDKEFVSTCVTCPHMGKITLERVRDALLHMQFQIEVDEDVAARARRSIERMLEVGRPPQGD
jgi:quinolinate synthase